MCHKFKNAMGNTGPASDFIHWCQKVQALIHKKSESMLISHSNEDRNYRDLLDGSDSNEQDDSVGEDDRGHVEIPALPPLLKKEVVLSMVAKMR